MVHMLSLGLWGKYLVLQNCTRTRDIAQGLDDHYYDYVL